ncbi:calcium calmodulin-dependent protein kinase [Chrysochromulina tobinii]|jgi:serine/threonine protein kinase|uniref:Calcium calmodulin-dependent protein kinase n=1 Tax=Chrysochromulina tobinii TaxID=1460289 RepID=A0A0M0JW83_9EUKA|nr:calcium calmodulin-dependent protein kinase [Chrysochromulina tobinii]|eukprot:KOO30844.1 calcium calmodulin-dependent protein kinase [Chrysochromulina sp. CCMP291]
MVDTQLPKCKYYRTKTLGNGAYGSVVIAYDDEGKEYAVKTFWDEGGEEDGWWDDDGEWHAAENTNGMDCGLLREIVMLRLLNGAHPNLMSLVDVSELDGRFAMVMPAAAGGSLSKALEKKTLSNKDKLRVAAKSLNALAFLHEHGIIHRDLKPDNILLDAAGDPIIADFSLAKVIGAGAIEAVVAEECKSKGRKRRRAEAKASEEAAGAEGPALTESMGTPTYTAPEIVNGEAYDCKADVFSMGVVLYEMFNGEGLTAWKNKHALQQVEAIRAKLSDKPIPAMLKAMLESDPQQRPTAAEALAMLPGLEKLGPMPTPGALLLPPAPAPGVANAAALAEVDAATHNRPSKRAKRGGGGAEEPLPGPAKLAKQLGARSAQTALDAEHLYRRSTVAQARGVEGVAACALISCKINEVETFGPDDVHALPALKHVEYDASSYAALEKEVLEEVGYVTISATAAASSGSD